MDKSLIYSFTPVEIELKSLSSKDRKDQMLQYNLDKNLQFLRWRFTGGVPKTSSDYDQVLTEFLSTQNVLDLSSVSGSPTASMRVDSCAVKLTVTSMEFFDKLEESGLRILNISLIYNRYTVSNELLYCTYRYSWCRRSYQGLL